MINIWIVTDVLICIIAMPSLALNYYTDKTSWFTKWKTTVLNTKRNALRKFYLNNETAKEETEIAQRSLSMKLQTRIK
jgi:hypothetical protein